MIKVMCEVCWFEFEAKRISAKYCSAACKSGAARHRKGQPRHKILDAKVDEKPIRKHCGHCGGTYAVKSKGRTAKYCSDSCRVGANALKKRRGMEFMIDKLGMRHAQAYLFMREHKPEGVDELAAKHGFHYSYILRNYRRTEGYFSLDPQQFGIQWNE